VKSNYRQKLNSGQYSEDQTSLMPSMVLDELLDALRYLLHLGVQPVAQSVALVGPYVGGLYDN